MARSGRDDVTKTLADETGEAEAMIDRCLASLPGLGDRLMDETRTMLEAGAAIEDIIWMLTPKGGTADLRQAWLADAPAEIAEVIRNLPARRQGRMLVFYLGPQGMFCQFWQPV